MSSHADSPPPLLHVLETCLYVKSAPKAAEFYSNAFGIKPAFVTVSLGWLAKRLSCSLFPF